MEDKTDSSPDFMRLIMLFLIVVIGVAIGFAAMNTFTVKEEPVIDPTSQEAILPDWVWEK